MPRPRNRRALRSLGVTLKVRGTVNQGTFNDLCGLFLLPRVARNADLASVLTGASSISDSSATLAPMHVAIYPKPAKMLASLRTILARCGRRCRMVAGSSDLLGCCFLGSAELFRQLGGGHS